MSKQTVEFAGEAVGALIPENGRLRFMAVKFSVWSLEGQLFATPDEARKAVAVIHGLKEGRAVFDNRPLPLGGYKTTPISELR